MARTPGNEDSDSRLPALDNISLALDPALCSDFPNPGGPTAIPDPAPRPPSTFGNLSRVCADLVEYWAERAAGSWSAIERRRLSFSRDLGEDEEEDADDGDVVEAVRSSCESVLRRLFAPGNDGFSRAIAAEADDALPSRAALVGAASGEDFDNASALSLLSSSLPILLVSSPTSGKDMTSLTFCGTPLASMMSSAGVQERASSAETAAL